MITTQHKGKAWCFMIAIALASCAMAAAAQPHPVILVYGFQPLPGFSTHNLWKTFAEYLSGNTIENTETIHLSSDHEFYCLHAAEAGRRDVFLSNYAYSYEPTTRDIFFYTRRFADEVAFIMAERETQQIDVVGHSMGGLIARTYAEIEDYHTLLERDDFHDYEISYGGGIGTLILLATPNHGAQIAALGQWFSILSQQLVPGSEYLMLLNAEHLIQGRLDALNPSIRYVSLAGQTCIACHVQVDEEACLRACIHEALSWKGFDLVVMMASAYLPGAENGALIGFNHVRSHVDEVVAAAVERILNGEAPPVAIYAPDLMEFQP